jgi:hypothetical protein
MRKILTGLSLFLMILIPCTVKSASSVAEEVSNHSVAVVFESTGVAIGSGTLIEIENKYAILTAAHVAKAAGNAPLIFCSYYQECTSSSYTEYIGGNNGIENDWAIYFIDKKPSGTKPARLNADKVDLGTDLWLSGVAEGLYPLIPKGSIAWINEINEKHLYCIISYSFSGFSGGGVYNNKGKLIAVIVAIRVSKTGIIQEDHVIAVPVGNIPLLN